jgi:hypothetical protein
LFSARCVPGGCRRRRDEMLQAEKYDFNFAGHARSKQFDENPPSSFKRLLNRHQMLWGGGEEG